MTAPVGLFTVEIMNINEELFDYVLSLPLIDTHEHLRAREEVRDRNTDVLKEYLRHYYNRDLISAGLSQADYNRIMEMGLTVGEKWKLLEPYWEVSRLTGYGRALDIAVKELYGIERISKETVEELNEKFQKSLEPGHFKHVLREKCNIEKSLLCVETLEAAPNYDPLNERSIDCDRELFTPVYIVNSLVMPESWADIERTERESGVRITSFDRWLEATEANIERAVTEGSPILKNSLAYVRSLRYNRPNRSEAEADFNSVFETRHFPPWHHTPVLPGKKFQDYMFRYILDIADRKGLIMQIHTGIQEGNGNILANSNPEDLANLFIEYPGVTFDVFHIGYPYQNILTALAKNLPNVFIDMCWAHIISSNASVQALLEYIDAVPLNKISGFGGDYLFIDGVYGHQYLARENIAKALSIKMEEGLFGLDEAKKVARMFLYENPKQLFRL